MIKLIMAFSNKLYTVTQRHLRKMNLRFFMNQCLLLGDNTFGTTTMMQQQQQNPVHHSSTSLRSFQTLCPSTTISSTSGSSSGDGYSHDDVTNTKMKLFPTEKLQQQQRYYGTSTVLSSSSSSSRTSFDSSSKRSMMTTSTTSSSSNDDSNNNSTSNNNKLSSQRGRDAVSMLPSYLSDARSVQLYDKLLFPNGSLQLSVAETKLMEQDWLVPAIQEFTNTSSKNTTTDDNNNHNNDLSDLIYYQPTSGRTDLKIEMKKYIENMLQLNDTSSSSSSLQLDGLILGAGCNAVLENLCFTLANAGDACLIPTPYYAAFEFDLVARAGVHVVPVNTIQYQPETKNNNNTNLIDPQIYYPNIHSLNAAYDKALQQGMKPKILLLSHPMNPLGICYPPHVIKECIDWCRSNEVHFISDEIYAGSVYNIQDANFVSALTLAKQQPQQQETDDNDSGLGIGPYVHWVYAFSKDYGLSGLRIGVAYTENKEIQLPMSKLNDLCQISSLTQRFACTMLQATITTTTTNESLNDDSVHSRSNPQNGGWSSSSAAGTVAVEEPTMLWHEAYRNENHKRLLERVQSITSLFDEYNIPYLPPTAGLFIWVDFSQFLPSSCYTTDSSSFTDSDDQQKRERILYLELMNQFGLLFTPGFSMKNENPGYFRFVFTAASDNEFQLALERIRYFIQCKKKQ